jgi:hypothetical protein
MRPFYLSIYKGNEKMGIINKEKRGKVILGYKGNRRMGIWLACVQGQVC